MPELITDLEIIGNVEIWVTILVVIKPTGRIANAQVCDSCSLGDIGELAAAFVAEQMIRFAVVRLAVRFAIDGVICRVQIQVAIVIEVSKHGSVGAPRNSQLQLWIECKLAVPIQEQLVRL